MRQKNTALTATGYHATVFNPQHLSKAVVFARHVLQIFVHQKLIYITFNAHSFKVIKLFQTILPFESVTQCKNKWSSTNRINSTTLMRPIWWTLFLAYHKNKTKAFKTQIQGNSQQISFPSMIISIKKDLYRPTV